MSRLAAYIRSRLAYLRDNQSRLVAVAEISVNHRPTRTPKYAVRRWSPSRSVGGRAVEVKRLPAVGRMEV